MRDFLKPVYSTRYAQNILQALNQKPEGAMYLGTVSGDVVKKRRADNRVARKSRQMNRDK